MTVRARIAFTMLAVTVALGGAYTIASVNMSLGTGRGLARGAAATAAPGA